MSKFLTASESSKLSVFLNLDVSAEVEQTLMLILSGKVVIGKDL